MPGFDPNSWYILTNFLQSPNNTLTAGQDTQTAFDPDSPSAVYLAPTSSNPSFSQQWQLFLINDTSASTYILRNRQIGAEAFLTTAWTTRKCGGGNCATVPVLAPYLNTESLWEFGSWGFSDPTGAAFAYNLGNGSNWRLDVMDGQETAPEMTDRLDTGRRGQHWNATAYGAFAASDSSAFGAIPTSATALLVQVATASVSSATITPYTASGAGSGSGRTAGPSSATSTANETSSSGGGSQQHSGLTTGASIGIGVGIAAAVFIILAISGFLLYRRRREKKRARQQEGFKTVRDVSSLNRHAVELDPGSKEPKKTGMTSNTSTEMPHSPSQTRSELGFGTVRYELHS